MAVAAPSAARCALLVLGRLSVMPVLRVIAAHEVRQILEAYRLLLQRVVNVGAVVVVPDLLSPGIRSSFVSIEKDDISLGALRVEHAGRQAQDGVEVMAVEVLPEPVAICMRVRGWSSL